MGPKFDWKFFSATGPPLSFRNHVCLLKYAKSEIFNDSNLNNWPKTSNLGKLGPNLPKFQVFGQLFKFASLNFSDFAYFNRQTWYLTDDGGLVARKKF